MVCRRRRGTLVAAIASAALVAGLGACGGDELKGPRADLVEGKRLFVARCGACHTLARAGTTGTTGPDLDAAFAQALADGMGRSTVEGIVHEQILNPVASMPAKLVTGRAARDVAAYVSEAVANPGEDEGALATAVRTTAQREASAQDGTLEIDADPTGRLAYVVRAATASPGRLEIRSRNDATIPHDIALQRADDGAQLAQGETVADGGVSTITVTVRRGRYTFYCTLPGHREGGMEGTLTVR